jgi:hypothetical protein
MRLLRALYAFVTLLACALCASACRKQERVFVNAKVFALNPDQFQGVHVAVRGRVTRVGPASAWFEMEDETGRILVSSERVSTRVRCAEGSQIEAEGVLRSVSGDDGLYFSMENLLHCRP